MIDELLTIKAIMLPSTTQKGVRPSPMSASFWDSLSNRSTARSLPGRLQRLAPPHQVIEHGIPALHQIFVIVQGTTVLQDAEEWFHRDIHLVPDGRHLQFDDYAAQGLDRACRAHAAVTDEGNRLAMPFLLRAVEGVLENCCGAVIILGGYCHEGVEFANTFSPSGCFRFGVYTPVDARRHRFVEERQPELAQIQHCHVEV